MLNALRRGRPALAWRIAAIAVIVGVVVALLPRQARPHSASKTSTGAEVVAAGSPPLAVVDVRLTAANFAGGKEFVLSQHTAQPTFIYAMAAWCGSCMPQARELVRLKREFGDRINLVMVDIDPNDTEANLRGFARAAGGPLGVWAFDREGSLTRPFAIRWLHTMILIRDGREVVRSLDEQSMADLRALATGVASQAN